MHNNSSLNSPILEKILKDVDYKRLSVENVESISRMLIANDFLQDSLILVNSCIKNTKNPKLLKLKIDILSSIEVNKKSLLLSDKIKLRKENRKELSWTVQIYGNGLGIRRFFYVPDFLDLDLCISHGVTLDSWHIPEYEINQNAYNLYYEYKRTDIYNNLNANKALTVPPPAILYRKYKKLCMKCDAKGTIVFPQHSTHQMDMSFDRDEYIKKLLDLPDIFKPLTICLHWNDIQKREQDYYLKYGLDVVTAGHSLDKNYLDNFYNILTSGKFVTSNDFGSFLVYAIELGNLFFFLGDRPKFINNTDVYSIARPCESKVMQNLREMLSIKNVHLQDAYELQLNIISRYFKLNLNYTEYCKVFVLIWASSILNFLSKNRNNGK